MSQAADIESRRRRDEYNLPVEVESIINEFAKPHRRMTKIVDYSFITRKLEKEADKLLYSSSPEVIAEADKHYQQFINRIIEIGGNPNDYINGRETFFGGITGVDGIFYRKPTKRISTIFKTSDKKATASFKKRTGLDRMVTTTTLTFTFPTPIGVGGSVVFDRKMPVGEGKGNISDVYIDEKELEKLTASAKYKKLIKDTKSKGWYEGQKPYGQYRNWRDEGRDWNEWLSSLGEE